jgi:hypothetical protein
MRDSNPRFQAWTAVTVSVAVILLLGGLYIAGYFYLGNEWRPGPGLGPHPIRMRVFPMTWLAEVYRPAAWVESQFRGNHVAAGDKAMLIQSSP